MINELFSDFTGENFLRFCFYRNGNVCKDSPFCGMSVRSAGSMRFRWNKKNPLRDKFLGKISGAGGESALASVNVSETDSGGASGSVSAATYENASGSVSAATSEACICVPTPVPVELIHSKIVYDVYDSEDTFSLQGDGIITKNKMLMPVVTVADCMPIFLFDDKSGVFGIVHSGWKGTGIIGEAIALAEKNYGSKAEDFCVILGPHIRKCCYIVNKERADYFAANFGTDCITPLEDGGSCYCGGKGLPVDWNNGNGRLFRLSLETANLEVLKIAGVKEENITVYKDCTCCDERLGSNRRETATANANSVASAKTSGTAATSTVSPLKIKQPAPFTVQAAFISWCPKH